ncbi:hypothetical protein CLOM_g13789 [Closterium sp. NIES-68]|nr:hypothetical protein CLOM_g13789 [Closterium sp. NIES-68]GJP62425.1 hypothetical protein CLOP_g19492 [Closterium sp. NIES-67]
MPASAIAPHRPVSAPAHLASHQSSPRTAGRPSLRVAGAFALRSARLSACPLSSALPENALLRLRDAGAGLIGVAFPAESPARSHLRREKREWRKVRAQADDSAGRAPPDERASEQPSVGAERAEATAHLAEAQPADEPAEANRAVSTLVTLFPLWVALACAAALRWPAQFVVFQDGRFVVGGLALTMLGMGLTISVDDFTRAVLMPRQLLAGVLLQYTVMPCLGALISRCLPAHLSAFATGLVLVACCPGGTASNIVTFLARGNVALSVLMTTASTLLAVVMTPLLTSLLAGRFVPVNGAALFMSTLQVVMLPVFTGTLLARVFPSLAHRLALFSPVLAVLTVALIVAGAISASAATICAAALPLLLSVLALHGLGFAVGYLLPRAALGLDESASRTIAIEVGMQNSVLGVVLAMQHFPDPRVAAPCAVSSVVHSLLGSLLAAAWRATPVPPHAHAGREAQAVST